MPHAFVHSSVISRSGHELHGTLNLAGTAAAIKSLDADLVALQEVDNRTVRSGIVDQTVELARMANYPFYAFGASFPYQVCLFDSPIWTRHDTR